MYAYTHILGFPGGTVGKNLPTSAGEAREALIPGSGR